MPWGCGLECWDWVGLGVDTVVLRCFFEGFILGVMWVVRRQHVMVNAQTGSLGWKDGTEAL